MYIRITLNPEQGADLGPNFTLTANVGTLVPSTATLTELLGGIIVLADNSATQVFITSQGVCTNALTISITSTTTTSTTTTSTTTTSTTTTLPSFSAATSTSSRIDACTNPEAPFYTFTVVGGIGSTMCDNIQIRSIYITLLNAGDHFWTKSGSNVKEWVVLLHPSGYNYAITYVNCSTC